MTYRLFEEKHHASLYQRYRFVPPDAVKELILQYLDKKKGKLVLAVDVGCGTGQNTRLLAPHFQEVVGIDISECQLEEARAVPGFPNATYRAGTAEDLPFPEGSVDLLAAASAAHWFHPQRFLGEVERILKPGGCVSLLGHSDNLELQYGTCGDRLSCLYKEVREFLSPYASSQVAVANSRLQGLFDSIAFPDKERIENIATKICLSVRDLMGWIESFSYYQAYLRAEPEAATTLLKSTQDRFLEEMGVSSPDTMLEVELKYFCVLACKPQ
ncbi:hypothetical protein SKAU_G00243330 [Synaphobranchus kaupii]|uniref:Methyltransferase type 11 domain-containing protein n=1 Tax=Synaphobranchus kaupii TaxID=118154 RepID=A0A9Q1IU40_SYNKA|nr:hypothetical protein SKAU_G00243330 [Synaphobranchus kaupii]